MPLPGPDQPRRRVVKIKKPKTLGGSLARFNRMPPIGTTPKRRVAPKLTTPKPAAPTPTGTTPTVNLGKYGMYAGIPGAINSLNQIDAEQTAHQNYVNQTVAPWLSAGLQGLAQFNTNAQNDYLRNIQGGAVGGAIVPGQIAASSPGGVVQGDNSYLTGAGQQYAIGQGNAAQQIAAYQSTMNKLQPTTLSQGYLNSLADYAKGLPALYSERRSAYTDKLNGYLAQVQQAQAQAQLDAQKFAETQRHNRVQESISATNSQTNAAFQASRLGLSASGQGFDQATQTTAAATPAPPGYLRDPATGKLYRDPSVPQASSTKPKTPKAAGQYDPNTLAKQGFVGGWSVKPKKLPAGAKSGYVQGTDGKWYVKPGTATGGRAPTATQIAKAQGAEPNKVYDKVNGYVIQGAIADDQNTGTGDLLRILRSLQPTDKKNFAKWYGQIIPVLRRIDPRYEEWMTGYIKRRKAGTGGVGWSGKL